MDRVNFLTLGCKVNQYETEAMMELFKNRGYEITDDLNCDIHVINTCTVTNMSDRKSRQQISKVKKNNPNAIIAVVGCYSQVSADEVEKIEGINVIIGTKYRNEIVDLCEQSRDQKAFIKKIGDVFRTKEFEDLSIMQQNEMTRAYIKVQEGCNQFCTFCIIPFARGRVRSRRPNSIYEEAKKLAAHGYKEVVLTGIHVASYGLDFKEDLSIIDVIEKISQIEDIKRIRLSSVEPRLITEEFLKRLKNTKKACDHFHLSLQSGSDRILQLMNRRYNTDEYYRKVQSIRKFFPDAGLTTDIIVGFPGETEDDFQKTLEFSKKVEFSKIHVFKYSPRKGTKAALMSPQIEDKVKKERSQHLIQLSNQMTNDILKRYVDRKIDVLFEHKNENGYMSGFTTNYLRVKVPYDVHKVNHILPVSIVSNIDEILIGN